MIKSIGYTTTMLAFAATLAMAAPAKAEEISGTIVGTQVEAHYIADPGDPSHVLGVEKYVSATSANLFGTVLETDFNTVEGDLKSGQLKVQGIISSRNSEGTLTGSYAGKSSVTADEKTNASKGTYEGTWELTGGTGRFAHVRAQGTTKAEINGTQFIGHITGTGTGFEKRASTQ